MNTRNRNHCVAGDSNFWQAFSRYSSSPLASARRSRFQLPAGTVAVCALALAGCSGESDTTEFTASDLESPALDIPPAADVGTERDPGLPAPTPLLGQAELGIDADSLLLTFENLTDTAGTLSLDALVNNPIALHYTENAGRLQLAPRERRRIVLAPTQITGLDLVNSEWTDARVNFDFTLEDGRKDGYPVSVFAEYGVAAAPRAVVSSGKSVGFPEPELPELVEKAGTLLLCFTRAASADEAAEHILDTNAEPEHCLHVGGGTGAERAGDLDRGAGLAALGEGDGVGAALIRERLARRAFSGVERTRAGALARLLAQVRIRNARTGDELHQLEGELIGDELVVRQLGLGVGGHHALNRAQAA